MESINTVIFERQNEIYEHVKTDVGFMETLKVVRNDTAVISLPVEAAKWKRSNDRLCPAGLVTSYAQKFVRLSKISGLCFSIK